MDAKYIKLYVEDRPKEGVFKAHPAATSDLELIDLEIHIQTLEVSSRKARGIYACPRGRALLMAPGLAGRKAWE